MMRLLLLLLLLLPGLAGADALLDLPTDGPLPVPVHVTLDINDIQGIRENLNTVYATVALRLSWHDSRLAFDPVKRGTERISYIDNQANKFLYEHWNPDIAILNQVGTSTPPGVGVTITPDGTVTLINTLSGGFFAHSDYTDFPLDRQNFPFEIASRQYNNTKVALVFDNLERSQSTISPAIHLPQWILNGLNFAHTHAQGWDGSSYDHLTVRINATRNTIQYAPPIFFPYFFIMMAPFAILLLKLDIQIQKTSMLSGAALGLLALQFAISANFPDVATTNNLVSRMLYLGVAMLIVSLTLALSLTNKNLKIFSDPHIEAEVHALCNWLPAALYLDLLAWDILTPLVRNL